MTQLMPMNDAAAFLCISKRTLRRLIDRRQIPFFKISGSIRLEKTDLESYIKRVRTGIRY